MNAVRGERGLWCGAHSATCTEQRCYAPAKWTTGRGWNQLLISVEQDAQDPAHEVQVVMGRRRGRSVQGKRSDISFGDTRQPL